MGNLFSVLFVTFLYALTYTSFPERTGRRRWEWLRSRPGWKRAIGGVSFTEWANRSIFTTKNDGPVVLVAGPNLTGVAFFWVFGFHGDGSLGKLDPLYTLPRIYFLVPFLRDVLLWSGAVEDSEEVVQELMRQRQNLVLSPGGLESSLLEEADGVLVVRPLPKYVMQYAETYNGTLIPVAVHGEAQRCPNALPKRINDALAPTRHVALDVTGHPFPMVRGFNPTAPLVVYDGDALNVKQMTGTAEDKLRVFHDRWIRVGSIKPGSELKIVADKHIV